MRNDLDSSVDLTIFVKYSGKSVFETAVSLKPFSEVDDPTYVTGDFFQEPGEYKVQAKSSSEYTAETFDISPNNEQCETIDIELASAGSGYTITLTKRTGGHLCLDYSNNTSK